MEGYFEIGVIWKLNKSSIMPIDMSPLALDGIQNDKDGGGGGGTHSLYGSYIFIVIVLILQKKKKNCHCEINNSNIGN